MLSRVLGTAGGAAVRLGAAAARQCGVHSDAALAMPCLGTHVPQSSMQHVVCSAPVPQSLNIPHPHPPPAAPGNCDQHSIKHIEARRRRQQQEAREAFAAAELEDEFAAYA